MFKQARDELRLRGRELPFEDATGWAAAVYLSQLIYDSIGEEVAPAREAMKYMQRLARVAAYFGQPLRWTTPVGFPVHQANYKYGAMRINTTVLGGCTSLQFNTDEPLKLSARSQAQAAAPNLIHSLDAAHLMLTIEACEREAGPLSWTAIHDCFGTHAGRVELLARKLRDTFAEMHQTNWLAEWACEVRSTLPAELPERLQLLEAPRLGNWEEEKVRAADYFAS